MRLTRYFLQLGFLLLLIAFAENSFASKGEYTTEQLLNLSLEDLMNVKISTASKRLEKIKDIPAAVSTVTRQDIERYGYTTLAEIIESIPGFYNIYNYTGVSGNFGLRGDWNPRGQNANFVILVNGVNQVKDDTRSNPLDKISVPVEAIDRIEVIRGPMSVMYGNGAFFGVINIVTNQPGDHDYIVSAGYGYSNTKKVSARINSQTRKLKYSINVSTYATDGIEKKFRDMTSPSGFAEFPGWGVSDVDASTSHILEQNNKFLNLSLSYQDWSLDYSHNNVDSGFIIFRPPVDEGSIRHVNTNTTMLRLNKEISQSLAIDSHITYGNYSHNEDFDALDPNAIGYEDTEFSAYEFESLVKLKSDDILEIVIGYNFRIMKNYRDFTDIPAVGEDKVLILIKDRKTWSEFFELSYKPVDKLKLVAGFRYETVKKSELKGFENTGTPAETTFGGFRDEHTNLSPRFAAIYSLNSSNTFKLIHSSASRISDDKFNHETINSTELNYLYTQENTLISISAYRNRLRDLLVKQLEINAFGNIREFDTQSGNISTTGVEFIANKTFAKHFITEFGLSDQISKDKQNQDLDVAYSPRILAHIKLSYSLKKHMISLVGRYVDSMLPYYDPTTDNGDGSYGARIGEKVAAYTVLDFNYRANNIYKSMYLNLHVTNALNREIHYPNDPFNTEFLDRGPLGQGRELMATLGWKF